jgi:hypothetical protein
MGRISHSLRISVDRALALPGIGGGVRALLGFLGQKVPLSVPQKEFLFNVFFRDESPLSSGEVYSRISVPGGKPVNCQLDLSDWLSRVWYFGGYGLYERGTVRLLSRLLRTKSCLTLAPMQVITLFWQGP